MNKTQLAADVATRTGTTPTEARRHVDAVLDSIVESVSAGERVSLLGFGTFTGAERPARTARNPRTGATVEVPAAVLPRFRAGTGFRSRVSGSEPTATPAARTAAPSKAESKAGSTKGTENKKAEKPSTKKDKKSDSKKKKDSQGKKSTKKNKKKKK
ncbi:HU family DNA-binding protein [Isoptericola aurantiacus]|uniref:HU family DNA-binding protein n=1 Tax=Isoptericola aurantiacus TaxID=3377839 RepID=UPI00383B4E0B